MAACGHHMPSGWSAVGPLPIERVKGVQLWDSLHHMREPHSSLDRVFPCITCAEDVQTARVGLQASHACGLRYSRTRGVEPTAASEGDG